MCAVTLPSGYGVSVSSGIATFYKNGFWTMSMPVGDARELFREMRRQHRLEKQIAAAETPEQLARQSVALCGEDEAA